MRTLYAIWDAMHVYSDLVINLATLHETRAVKYTPNPPIKSSLIPHYACILLFLEPTIFNKTVYWSFTSTRMAQNGIIGYLKDNVQRLVNVDAWFKCRKAPFVAIHPFYLYHLSLSNDKYSCPQKRNTRVQASS